MKLVFTSTFLANENNKCHIYDNVENVASLLKLRDKHNCEVFLVENFPAVCVWGVGGGGEGGGGKEGECRCCIMLKKRAQI